MGLLGKYTWDHSLELSHNYNTAKDSPSSQTSPNLGGKKLLWKKVTTLKTQFGLQFLFFTFTVQTGQWAKNTTPCLTLLFTFGYKETVIHVCVLHFPRRQEVLGTSLGFLSMGESTRDSWHYCAPYICKQSINGGKSTLLHSRRHSRLGEQLRQLPSRPCPQFGLKLPETLRLPPFPV